jgi:hypothetical protein
MIQISPAEIDAIFVPQGSEYQAVCRGIREKRQSPSILPIPMGYPAASLYFQRWLSSLTDLPRQVLLMGLAGSLSPDHRVGQMVVYRQCGKLTEANQVVWRDCVGLTLNPIDSVKGWTSDRIICSVTEKQHLHQTYGATAVDMEGFAMLETLQPQGIKVAILRVISDDVRHNLPNLAGAIGPDGQLQPFPLAVKMLQDPLASLRLIRGSLKGLKVLEQVAKAIEAVK